MNHAHDLANIGRLFLIHDLEKEAKEEREALEDFKVHLSKIQDLKAEIKSAK